jgi:hypothetical protein
MKKINRILIQASVYILAISFTLLLSSWQASGAETSLALSYNFNGMVHTGETGSPDAANGFRSISDRALIIDGTPTSLSSITSPLSQLGYTVVNSAGVLDIIHIGDRNTVDSGNWAFDAVADGDDIGIQPSWLPVTDQTIVNNPVGPGIPMRSDTEIGILYNISNGGGDFDVTLSFSDFSSITVTLNGPDWYGPSNEQPGSPGPGVAIQANLPGTFKGSGNVDSAVDDADLLVTEAVITAPLLLSNLGFNINGRTLTNIGFSNRSNDFGGYAVYAVTVKDQQSIAVPSMTHFGMIFFVVFAGLGSVLYMKRQGKEIS